MCEILPPDHTPRLHGQLVNTPVTEPNVPSRLAIVADEHPVQDMLDFIDGSPSPYHVVETVADRLDGVGFVELAEADEWPAGPGSWMVRRSGSIIAWRTGGGTPTGGFRLIGAHTDSPNLRIKPQPDTAAAGYRQVGVEVYGGVLLNSWLDRELGVSGRLTVRDSAATDGTGVHSVLVRIDEPILRLPQLAIHLDRDVSDKGLVLNRQWHMSPTFGVGDLSPGLFASTVAAAGDVDPADVLSWDIMCHDLNPSAVVGLASDLIAAPRLDNQMSCWAGIEALAAVEPPSDVVTMVGLFDHEEVGSKSSAGAASSMLPTVIERIVTAGGGNRDDYFRSLARTVSLSADGAHATHPNYVDRHEPNHHIALNGGPVVKINANQKYATTADSHGAFILACEAADVPYQRFVSRTDLRCGSTIGPATSSLLGVSTADVGIPQLAMHSARETAGAFDPPMFVAALKAFLG